MEAENKEKYFNFPIVLLDGFLVDSNNCLNNIFDYAVFVHSQKHYIHGNEIEMIESACNFFGVTTGSPQSTFNNGQILYNSIDANAPKSGINTSIFFDFYKNDKTEFEKACLLAHLALKSIIGNKNYCKITNNFLLARMDGKIKSVEFLNELSPQILKFSTRYQLDKIKKELEISWGLQYYARYTRGFYASYKMPMDELVFQAEKKRKSRLKKKLSDDKKESIKRALNRLNN